MLLIRADASAEVGTGHIMRCLALGQAAIDDGCPVTFLCHGLSAALGRRLAFEGFTVRELPREPGSDEDADYTAKTARELDVRAIVVDGYHFDQRYGERLKGAGVPLVYIDDSPGEPAIAADLILNQNLWASDDLYPGRQVLTGSAYTLLRREFVRERHWVRDLREEAENILINLGGADPQNFLRVVLETFSEVKGPGKAGFSLHVLCGAHNPRFEELAGIAGALPHRVRIEAHLDDIPGAMKWADIAISGAGFTTFELAFMGVASLIIVNHPLQAPNARFLDKEGLALTVTPTDGSLLSGLRLLSCSKESRERVVARGRELFDGSGASRVYNTIIKL